MNIPEPFSDVKIARVTLMLILGAVGSIPLVSYSAISSA